MKRKTVCKFICFLLVLSFIFIKADDVLMVKYPDGILSIQRFYEIENDTVDVLVLGSSHAFETFNTSVLWKEHGISAYVLGGSMQPMWNTYFYLKEALKTQSPKLIILEGYACTFDFDESDYSRKVKNCYGMKPSLNKLQAMLVSSETIDPNFFFPLRNYAARYSELNAVDFLGTQINPKYRDWMGFGDNYDRAVCENVTFAKTDRTAVMTEKTEEYYRKILRLAEDRNRPLMVVISPYPDVNEEEILLYNSAEIIAGEYNASFINYALDPGEWGLDFSVHCADPHHLNEVGNRIFTGQVADHISAVYSIPDHRGDMRYESWERGSEYIDETLRINELHKINDTGDIAGKLKTDNYGLFILTGADCSEANDILAPFDLPALREDKVYCTFGSSLECLGSDTSVTYQDIYLTFHDDLVYSDRKRLSDEYSVDKNAVKIVVYDTITDDICDEFTIYSVDPQHIYR